MTGRPDLADPAELLKRLGEKDILARVSRAAKRRQAFTDDLHQLIRAAFEAGHSGSKIAEAAGLSKPRVFQIRDGK